MDCRDQRHQEQKIMDFYQMKRNIVTQQTKKRRDALYNMGNENNTNANTTNGKIRNSLHDADDKNDANLSTTNIENEGDLRAQGPYFYHFLLFMFFLKTRNMQKSFNLK